MSKSANQQSGKSAHRQVGKSASRQVGKWTSQRAWAIGRRSSVVGRRSSVVGRHSSFVIRHSSFITHHSSLIIRIAPWIAFAALLAWGWRGQNLFHDIPTYGDVLELMWGVLWYDDALRAGISPAVYPLAFYPVGWQLATFGQSVGPALFLAMIPLHRFGGAAFAYQVLTLLTFVLSFGGMLALAGRFMGRLGATVAALLFTFWGFRWFQTIGHLNFLLGSACLPWLVWALERFFQRSSAFIRVHPHPDPKMGRGRARMNADGAALEMPLAASLRGASFAPKQSPPMWGIASAQTTGLAMTFSSSMAPHTAWLSVFWLLLAGIAWAAAIAGSMYFIWIGGLLVAGWVAGRWWGKEIHWRTALIALIGPAAVALLLSAPALLAYWRASTAIAAGSHDLVEVNFWGASLNSLPLPYVFHPWLKSFATAVYRGITYEQGTANLGLVAVIAAVAGWAVAWRTPTRRRWLPVFLLTPVALLLCLGLTLKWDNVALQWDALQPVNAALWQIGHLVKPEVFPAGPPPAPFDAAIPLPGLLLSMVVPLFERARVFARYIFIAALGVSLLAGFAVTRLRWPLGAHWLLAAALIFEVIPPPLERVPFPPPAHPAFAWLLAQPDGAVADLLAAHPDTLVLINRGETVWATRLHGKPAVGGASSVWPAPATFLNDWLATHGHAFTGPTIAPLLRFYGTRYLLLHMTGDWEISILEEAKQNRELRFIQCFEPPAGPSAWPYPICALELLPAAGPTFNLAPVEGWSGQEDWGVWAVGPESRALWVATDRQGRRLTLEAFPNCIPGKTQALVIEINGARLAEHSWDKCEPWAATVTIPPAMLQLGGNALTFRPAYAVVPAGGDTRPLSVGFSRLRVE